MTRLGLGWALLVGGLSACGPECALYDVLRADLTRATGEGPVADAVYSEGAGGLKVQNGVADPSFSPLEAALIGTSSAAGTARISANFGSDQLLVLELPFPLSAGQVLPIDTLVTEIRFTGGYEGYGWWDSAWRWSDPVAGPKGTLIALFEDSLSAASVTGQVTVEALAPATLIVDLVVTDKKANQRGVYAKAVLSRDLGVKLCSTEQAPVSP